MVVRLSLIFFLLLTCWQAAGQEKRSSSFVHDQSLLKSPERFGDIEIAFPQEFNPLPDSLRLALEKQSNQGGLDGFVYQIQAIQRDSLGNAIALSHILDRRPDAEFAYLERYVPLASDGKKLEYSVRQLVIDPIVLREYRFIRSGYIVRQLFTHSPRNVYKVDFLVKGSWSRNMINTFESVVSSIRFVSTPHTP